MKYYSGIGSREIPEDYMRLCREIAAYLAKEGYVLRSGGANGSDTAFEQGCDSVMGDKKIYIPWRKFNNSTSINWLDKFATKDKALELAKKYHPAWEKLSQGAQKLMARNIFQVLGEGLDSPSNFVVCYTNQGKGGGGTGQALRVAKDYGVPIFDLGSYIIEDIDFKFKMFYRSMEEQNSLNDMLSPIGLKI